MDERYYNAPDLDKETKTTDCEICDSIGKTIEYVTINEDLEEQEIEVECQTCKGKGYLEY